MSDDIKGVENVINSELNDLFKTAYNRGIFVANGGRLALVVYISRF
ncbi:MAG: hypothetical protein RR011_04415 [Oscillospiraceae bacterium]